MLALLLLMPFFLWLYQWRLFTIELDLFSIMLAFLLQDFLYYWFHRASHHIRWLWASHVVHHSSEYYNLSTALRQTSTGALLGWAAVKGWPAGTAFLGLAGAPLHYDHALLLVLIIYVWTPPHFWALAIFRRDDYAKALIPMLPVVYGVTYTRWQILFYTVLLVVVTVLPYVAGMSGVFYLGGALVLGGVFLYYAIRLLNPPGELYAMKVFNYSIVYLMALFAFLLADHWLLPAAVAAVPALDFVPAG